MTNGAGQNRVRKKKANDFIIWRAGTSVDWDCTATELAEETGLSAATILKTCKRRGWRLLNGQSDVLREDLVHRFDVLQIIKGMSE